MYSSIEESSRKEVIRKCYWPILNLTESGIPVGLEASGLTLELIREIDSKWVDTLKILIANRMIEFIGSGYSQLIGPLVPAPLNKYNQSLGLEVYQRLLCSRPELAVINEMAYSGGIIEHYRNSGYAGVIMEWNNPRSSHPEWENDWRYYPQKAFGCDNQTIPLIWADSIAFQKFQRYAHDEYDLDDYVTYIKSHIGNNDRFFPLYSNDVEIFNYRPKRYSAEADVESYFEWNRIIELYQYLNKQDWCDFVFPSEVLSGLDSSYAGNKIKLESPSQPIPVKKQEKYNINRWALTGRYDLGINTRCYQIYDGLNKNDNTDPYDWKELCYLWSSDFRTHITEKRWEEYVVRLNKVEKKWSDTIESRAEEISNSHGQFIITEDNKQFTADNEYLKIVLNKNKGLTIKELIFKELSNKPLLGTLDHGYYDDISLGADYYSGHTVIEIPGEHKVTDLGKLSPEIVKKDNCIALKTEQEWVHYKFNNNIQINSEKIILEKSINANVVEKVIIRPYNFTFNPEAWDQTSLYIKTHNGGTNPEKFYLKGKSITHGDIYSSLISARHGFGNTEGLFIVGDKDKKLTFSCDMSIAALIPSIIYSEMNDSFFFRLQYSARELDETLIGKNIKHNYEISILIQAR